VRSCEKFFKELDLIIAKTEKEKNKFKSLKPQAASAIKKPQLNNRINK
jgi:3-deoxy-D-manno-octulosonic-acid transferase